MKKGKNIVYFGILFLAAFLSEVYCLLQFREDVITVIGVGIVLLIAAYLWMDAFRMDYFKELEKQEQLLQNLEQLSKNDKSDELAKIEAKLQDMEKLQKALYVAARKSIAVAEENLKQVKLGYEKEIDYSTLVERLTAEQMRMMKTLAKYNREDTKFIIAGTKTETNKVIQAMSETSKNVAEQLNLQLSEQISIGNSLLQGIQDIHIQVSVPKVNNQEKMNKEEIEESVLLEETQDEAWQETQEETSEVKLNETEDEIKDEMQVENQVDISEKILEAINDDIKDVPVEENLSVVDEQVYEVQVEEELKVIEEVKAEEKIDQEIAATKEAVEQEEIKAEEEIVPISTEEPKKDSNIEAILSDDPNKALSADDIAALFASLGQ